MVAIVVWIVVVSWCIAALFLVSLPFAFAVMCLIGKGELAKSWWLKIKPRFKSSSSYQHKHPDYIFDPMYKTSICNIFNTDRYRHR